MTHARRFMYANFGTWYGRAYWVLATAAIIVASNATPGEQIQIMSWPFLGGAGLWSLACWCMWRALKITRRRLG